MRRSFYNAVVRKLLWNCTKGQPMDHFVDCVSLIQDPSISPTSWLHLSTDLWFCGCLVFPHIIFTSGYNIMNSTIIAATNPFPLSLCKMHKAPNSRNIFSNSRLLLLFYCAVSWDALILLRGLDNSLATYKVHQVWIEYQSDRPVLLHWNHSILSVEQRLGVENLWFRSYNILSRVLRPIFLCNCAIYKNNLQSSRFAQMFWNYLWCD